MRAKSDFAARAANGVKIIVIHEKVPGVKWHLKPSKAGSGICTQTFRDTEATIKRLRAASSRGESVTIEFKKMHGAMKEADCRFFDLVPVVE